MAGQINTPNKTTWAGSGDGFFINHEGKVWIGDDENYLKYDGDGSFSILGTLSVATSANSRYTWVKYATNATGTTGFTDTYVAGTTTYVGYAYNKTTATESNTAGDYIWSRLEGVNADNKFTWIKYATNATGTTGFSDAYSLGKTYVGMAFNKTTATESTTPGDYTWSRLEGVNADNKFMWVKYGTNASGAGLTDTYTAGTTTYIGMAFNKTTATESTTPGDYIWTKIEGEDGLPTFTWTKYGTNASGAGLTDTYTEGTTTYIGMAFNKTTATESTTAGDYVWSKLQGEPGQATYTWIKYGTNASGAGLTNTYTAGTTTYVGMAFNKTTATESTTAGDYVWSKLEGVNADNKFTWVKYGTNASGAGLTDTYTAGTTTYIGMAFNKTTATESTTPGDYVWTKIEGEDGLPNYTWVKYGTNASGAGLTDTYTAGTTTYIGMAFNKTTATESTTPGDYVWTKIEGTDSTVEGPSGPGMYQITGASNTTSSQITAALIKTATGRSNANDPGTGFSVKGDICIVKYGTEVPLAYICGVTSGSGSSTYNNTTADWDQAAAFIGGALVVDGGITTDHLSIQKTGNSGILLTAGGTNQEESSITIVDHTSGSAVNRVKIGYLS
jgi:hypothetical protein